MKQCTASACPRSNGSDKLLCSIYQSGNAAQQTIAPSTIIPEKTASTQHTGKTAKRYEQCLHTETGMQHGFCSCSTVCTLDPVVNPPNSTLNILVVMTRSLHVRLLDTVVGRAVPTHRTAPSWIVPDYKPKRKARPLPRQRSLGIVVGKFATPFSS